MTNHHQCSRFASWISVNFGIPLSTTKEANIIVPEISNTETEKNINTLPFPKTIGEMIQRKNGMRSIPQSSPVDTKQGPSNGKHSETSKNISEEIIIDSDPITKNEVQKYRRMTVQYNEADDTEDIMVIEEICKKKPLNGDTSSSVNRNRIVLEKATSDTELEELYAQIPILKPRPPRKEVKFISNDEKENLDNMDERWSELKKLRSDSELHTYARAAFGNKECSDPNRCLSFQGFRRRENFKRNQFRPINYEFNHQDIKIDYGKIIKLNWWDNVSDGLHKKRKAFDEPEGMPLAKRQRLITFDIYEKEMRRALSKGHLDPKYWKYSIRHFKKGIEETKSFLRMYSNQREIDGEKVYMTEEELRSNCCIELIFRQSVQYYGDNPLRKCLDCSDMDKENISHPY